MTDDADDLEAGARPDTLRLATLVLGSAEAIAVLLLAHLVLQSGDPFEAGDGVGTALLAALAVAGLVLPGLLLAGLGRAPRTALAFVLLALPATATLWLSL